MRRHLAATAPGVPFREIFETELTGGHAAPEHESAIPIIRDDIVVGLHLDGDRCQSLVAHSGNVEVSLALADQILFAQIRMPALQHHGQEPQLVFFAKGRHTVDFTSRLSIDNHADLLG